MYKKAFTKQLTAAVLLTCSSLLLPYYAQAEEQTQHKENLWQIDLADKDGKQRPFAIMDVYTHKNDPAGLTEPDENGEEHTTDYREFLDGEKTAITNALQYIGDIVGLPQAGNVPLIKLELLSDEDDNASADSSTALYRDANGKLIRFIAGTELAESIQAQKAIGFTQQGDYIAEIAIDKASPNSGSWDLDNVKVLPDNGTQSEYAGTVTHEMFHALGLIANTYQTDGENKIVGIGTIAESPKDSENSETVLSKYELGLRDAFGRACYIYTDSNDQSHYAEAEGFLAPNGKLPDGYKLTSREVVGISLEEYNNLKNDPNSLESNKFYIIKDAAVNVDGGVAFTGTHVKEVLTLNGEEALIAPASGSDSISIRGGLPINCYEGNEAELSHIELQNSLMSHQPYRNWGTFMEAELALLQDLGYSIDRSKYFGRSIYNSGTLDEDGKVNYFKYTNTKGFDSKQSTGIGLHIYGSYVDVEQKATIKAAGDYSLGIRVDGVGNKLSIDSKVAANGKNSSALAVCYGKQHEITLQKGASLTALGKDGVAARFDFGSNELSDTTGYRGSYINAGVPWPLDDDETDNEDDAETATDAEAEGSLNWQMQPIPDAIKGELVTSFDVRGTLAGEKAAIYISPNALVKNINIMNGAKLTGDIISEWNPKKIIYQNENEEDILKPMLPEGENGMTALKFGVKANEDDEDKSYVADKDFKLRYDANIKGKESIDLKIVGGELSFNGTAEVNSVLVVDTATLKGNATYTTTDFTNNGTLAPGNSIGTINIKGNFTNKGTLATEFMADGTSDKIIVDGTATVGGKLELIPLQDYYASNTSIKPVESTGNLNNTIENENISVKQISPVLNMTVQPTSDESTISIVTTRPADAYSQCADDAISQGIATAFDSSASQAQGDARSLVAAVDFAGTKQDINAALKKLNPAVYSSSAQATLNTHSMLNNLSGMGSFAQSQQAEAKGGRGKHTASAEAAPHSWRTIVTPFSSYLDQHNGSRGYTSHNSGALGARERTLDNGLTVGYHAAVTHQSTSEGGSRIKGEGFYLGTQASYAPASWRGWSLFGNARLGLEQMRSHRAVHIGSYTGTADADWTGYSGSFRLGTALAREQGVIKSGPFAALTYSFAHQPGITEKGSAIRTQLGSATYDSLCTQLGYQLTTAPKRLDSYDTTKWQAHLQAAWNHELLNNNGSTSFTLAELPGPSIHSKAELYGRDSLSLVAGLTFNTPKKLDITINLGSDIYRKGGSAIYGKVTLERRI